jgi:hypothetical protein
VARASSKRFRETGRFDVAVNDASSVSGIERVGDFDSE